MSTLLPCISLWQPWASLVMCGAKKIETRSYRPPSTVMKLADDTGAVRVLIHAAKTGAHLHRLGHSPWGDHLRAPLPLGAILGCVSIRLCRPITEEFAAGLTQQERTFGDYTPGRVAWMLQWPVRIPPHPYRGRQGFFWVPEDVLPVMEGFCDIPTGWRLDRESNPHDHGGECSRHTGCLLCDCGYIEREWARRVAAQRAARGEA